MQCFISGWGLISMPGPGAYAKQVARRLPFCAEGLGVAVEDLNENSLCAER